MLRQAYALTLIVVFAAACGSDATITTPEARVPGPVLAIGTDPVSGATIETNLDDYMPGEVVHVTGRGWAANETVRMFMTEDPDTHEDVTMDVVADAAGGFSVHFYDVQEHDLGVTFTLTATGQTSGSVATAVFTDNRVITKIELLDPSTNTYVEAPAQIAVNGGGSFTVRVTGTTNGEGGGGAAADDWESTRLRVRGPMPGNGEVSQTCDGGIGITTATVGAQHIFVVTAPVASGTYTLQATAFRSNLCADGPSAEESYASGIVVTAVSANQPPDVDAGGPYSGAEGSAIALSEATASDPDVGDVLTYAWTVNTTGIDAGGSCSFSPNNTVLNPSVTCTDDSGSGGQFTLTLEVNDGNGHIVTSDAELTVTNANPSVTLNSPTDGALFSLLNGAIAASASYGDAGSNDTHMCRLELDGALDVIGSYAAVSGGTCAGSITPVEAGVYTLTVRVKDDDGGEGTAAAMVIVYDPSAGFVTGGGWIQSDPGAYRPDVYLSGKATFGFVSKYKKGATTPEGNTEFQFHAGGMTFHSSQYQWLVVNQAGTNAQFKGTGTINGLGSYTFMLWATDSPTGDKFRMQISDNNDNGATVYDNGTEQLIASGSIVIHTGGKK